MKLYRGISKEQYKLYQRDGIPEGTNFTNTLVEARSRGNCIIQVRLPKKDWIESFKDNYTLVKEIKLKTKYFKNKIKIPKSKIKLLECYQN